MTTTAAAKGEWRETVIRAFVVSGPVRTLSVQVSEVAGEYLVHAVDVPTLAVAAFALGAEAGAHVAYDEHGHKVVGTRATLEGARAAAEAYAEMWAASQAREAERCRCTSEGMP